MKAIFVEVQDLVNESTWFDVGQVAQDKKFISLGFGRVWLTKSLVYPLIQVLQKTAQRIISLGIRALYFAMCFIIHLPAR